MQGALTKALQQTGVDKIKMAGKEELRDIEVYDAETKRLAILSKHMNDQDGLKLLVQQLVHETLNNHLDRQVQLKQIETSQAEPAESANAA